MKDKIKVNKIDSYPQKFEGPNDEKKSIKLATKISVSPAPFAMVCLNTLENTGVDMRE